MTAPITYLIKDENKELIDGRMSFRNQVSSTPRLKSRNKLENIT